MPFLVALLFLPYFKLTPMGSDTQPYVLATLLALFLYYAIRTGRLPIYPVTLVLSILFFLIGVASEEYMQGLSLAVFVVAVDFLSRQRMNDIVLGSKIAVLLLLFGAALDVAANNFVSQVVSNYRGSAQRGINSFSSEPSYLGLMGFALLIVFTVFGQNFRWILASSALVLLSASATAIIPFAIFATLTLIKGWRLALVPIFIGVLVFGLNYAAETDTRFGNLARIVLVSPELIFEDVSFSNRFIRSFGPLVVSYQNDFLPQGLSADERIEIEWVTHRADEGFWRLSNISSVLVYGLGFLCIPLIYIYLIKATAPLSVWFAVLFFSIVNLSIATPYVWLIFAIPIFLKRNKQKNIESQRHGVMLNISQKRRV